MTINKRPSVAEAYYKLKKFEVANKIVKTIVYNYKHDINPLDDNLIMTRGVKNDKVISDARDLMNRYSQDTTILDKN